jgi:protein kinase C substrate 80K-H
MAVLEAVRGWEQVAGPPHNNDAKKDEGEGGKEPPSVDVRQEISGEDTERQVENVLNTNYVSLLMEHDQYVENSQASPNSKPSSPSPFYSLTCYSGLNLASYIPRSLVPTFDYIRSFASVISGWNPSSTDVAEVSRLRQSLSDAEASLHEMGEKLKSTQQDLEDLFKPDKFGKDGVWKKLDKLCLEKDTGEYVLPITPHI